MQNTQKQWRPEILVSALLAVVLILAACSVSIGSGDTLADNSSDEPQMEEPGQDVENVRQDETPVPVDNVEDKNEPVSSDDPVEPAPTFSEEERARFKEAAYLEGIQLVTLESFPVQMHAVLTGSLPDGCTRIAEIQVEKPEDNVFEIHIYTLRPEGLSCTQALVPFEENVPLDVYGLPAGDYTVKAYEIEETFSFQSANSLE